MLKKNIKITICIIVLLLGVCEVSRAQIASQAELKISSYNPKSANSSRVATLPKLNYKSVFSLTKQKGGIIADVHDGGQVTVTVYNYDPTKVDGKGKIVYQIYSDETSSDYVAKTFNLKYEVLNINFDDPVVLTTHSDDIKKLAQEAKIYAPDECKIKKKLTWIETIVNFLHGWPDYCQEAFKPTRPVIVEATVKNATFHKFKVPGMGEFDAKKFFQEVSFKRINKLNVHVLEYSGLDRSSDYYKQKVKAAILRMNQLYLNKAIFASSLPTGTIGANTGIFFKNVNINILDASKSSYNVDQKGIDAVIADIGSHFEERALNIVLAGSLNDPGSAGILRGVALCFTCEALGDNGLSQGGKEFILLSRKALFNGGQGSGSAGGTFAHEVGHFFDLPHPFGTNKCEDHDKILDTPPAKGPFWYSTVDDQGISHRIVDPCNNAPSCNGKRRQVENVMDYGPCRSIFTPGQAQVMNDHLQSTLPSLYTEVNHNLSELNDIGDALSIITTDHRSNRSRRNVALHKETRQSSDVNATEYASSSPQFTAGESERIGHSGLAVDDNIDGFFSGGSVAHTDSEYQPWWEVDLEEITLIDAVVLHNRTDCCTDQLSNYYLLISNQPFGNASLDELKARPDVHEFHQPAISGTIETFVPEVWGRYVRVQLAGTDALSLAEVEVHGSPLSEPLGHWKLDDEVLNSGSTSVALPSGAIPQGGVYFDGVNYREGWGSLSFDGSGYAELSPLNGDSFLHDGFADRSVSLWVRVEEATTQTIYDEGGTSNGLAIRYHANGTIEVATRNNGTQFTLPGYPIERGLWYHVAATYGAGGRLRLYIDGHQVSEGFAPYTTVNASSDNAAIGATVSEDAFGNVGTGQYLTGQIDDVRVFDSELGIGDLGWYRYPKASFKSLGSYSPGELITFTDASTNNPTSWQWTFEGGSPSVSTDQHPVVSFGAPGSYAVTLQVGNAQGISEPVRGHVNVTDLGSDHYYRLVNTATGKALEVEGWSRDDGANIRQWDYVGGTNQLFVLEKDLNSPTGGVTIRPAHTLPLGKVLEAGVGGPGTGAIAWHDNFTNHQRWHIVPRGLGLGNDFYIVNDYTNLVLSVQDGSTANGAEVIVSTLDAYNDAHHWRLESVAPLDANVQPLVTYELEAAHSGLLFDLYFGATADGTPIHQWPRNGTNAQKWYFQQLNRIEWELYSVHTNKLVEKGGGDGSGAGAGVNQWIPLDFQRQRWIMMELGNELYGLVNAQRPDLCAVVQSGALSEGANVELQPCRLEDATHQWRLKPEGGVVYSVARQQSEEEGDIPAELETAYEGLQAYPNPTTDAVTLQFAMESSGLVDLSIVDLQGKSIYKQSMARKAGNQQIELDNLKAKGLKAGVYVVKISFGSEVLESRLIIR